jgi:hypothetical protein
VFFAAEDFSDPYGGRAPATEEVRRRFFEALSRARPKELAHDYLEPGTEAVRTQQSLDNSPAAGQARSRAAWLALREKADHSSAQDVRAQARERWQAYRQGLEKSPASQQSERSAAKTRDGARELDEGQSL